MDFPCLVNIVRSALLSIEQKILANQYYDVEVWSLYLIWVDAFVLEAAKP